MYTAFRGHIDDSGDKQIFSLSCLLSKSGNWQWIEQDWNRCLAEKNKSLALQGRKQILRYHSVDMNNFKEEYADWSPDERKEFSTKLLDIFKKPSNCAIAYSRSIELKPLVRLMPEIAPKPYLYAHAILLQRMMMDIGASFSKANNGDPSGIKISLIHDRSRYAGALQHAFQNLKSKTGFPYADLFTSLTPMGWEDCIALQPADLVAYENFKEVLRQKSEYEKDRTRPMRIPLKEFLSSDSIAGVSKHIGEEAIQEVKNYLDSKTNKILDIEPDSDVV